MLTIKQHLVFLIIEANSFSLLHQPVRFSAIPPAIAEVQPMHSAELPAIPAINTTKSNGKTRQSYVPKVSTRDATFKERARSSLRHAPGDERSHRFVCTARLQLVVGALALLALATLKRVRARLLLLPADGFPLSQFPNLLIRLPALVRSQLLRAQVD